MTADDSPNATRNVLTSRTRTVALVCLLGVALTIFARQAWRSGSERPYRTLTASADPLRSRFNENVGQVRIVMLVAPT
jgi:hypothetical protein